MTPTRAAFAPGPAWPAAAAVRDVRLVLFLRRRVVARVASRTDHPDAVGGDREAGRRPAGGDPLAPDGSAVLPRRNPQSCWPGPLVRPDAASAAPAGPGRPQCRAGSSGASAAAQPGGCCAAGRRRARGVARLSGVSRLGWAVGSAGRSSLAGHGAPVPIRSAGTSKRAIRSRHAASSPLTSPSMSPGPLIRRRSPPAGVPCCSPVDSRPTWLCIRTNSRLPANIASASLSSVAT